jgi:CheY-like chemotaxis protein
MPISYRVLVVDDSDHVRILVSKLLKTRGFQFVEMAANGKLGLEKVRTFRPQLIFLDAIMPEVNGLAVLREVKKEYPGIIALMNILLKNLICPIEERGAETLAPPSVNLCLVGTLPPNSEWTFHSYHSMML